MYAFIFLNGSTPDRILLGSASHPLHFDTKWFILITGITFVLGHLLEMIVHIFLNPFAKFRPRYAAKRCALYVIISGLSMVCIGFLTNFLHEQYAKMDEYKNLFIPFMTILVMGFVTTLTFHVDALCNFVHGCLMYVTSFKYRTNVGLNDFVIIRRKDVSQKS